MLYVTTREKYDAYTAPRTLAGDCNPDGGLYLPFQIPVFSSEEIYALKEKSFGQCVAEILNRFFSTRLTPWDVEFSVGRHPVKIATVSHRILAAELWRNLDGSYSKMEQRLAAKIINCGDHDVKITSWLRIAIRIAVMFGIFSQLFLTNEIQKDQSVDIAVPAGDFSLPMALWYSRRMGLPIANIICTCNDNDLIWDLIQFGEIRGYEACPELERLIYGTLGIDEVLRCQELCHRSGSVILPSEALNVLRNGIFAAVVSKDRMESVIHSVYRTGSYILDQDAAYGYGGLMDFRAKSGESRVALLLADNYPADQAQSVAPALKMTEKELRATLENS